MNLVSNNNVLYKAFLNLFIQCHGNCVDNSHNCMGECEVYDIGCVNDCVNTNYTCCAVECPCFPEDDKGVLVYI